jgi:hypothetical protein
MVMKRRTFRVLTGRVKAETAWRKQYLVGEMGEFSDCSDLFPRFDHKGEGYLLLSFSEMCLKRYWEASGGACAVR